MISELAFWCSVALVLYAYVGYPCALMALSLFRNRPVKEARITPRVSFVIAAHNEERRIGEKIENTLRQDYPAGALEIIVASDCSTDLRNKARVTWLWPKISRPLQVRRAHEPVRQPAKIGVYSGVFHRVPKYAAVIRSLSSGSSRACSTWGRCAPNGIGSDHEEQQEV